MLSIPKLLGYIEIIDAADTYLVEGSQLPVYVTSELDMYVADECATVHPCEHSIAVLHEDGVVFKFITDGEICHKKVPNLTQ